MGDKKLIILIGLPGSGKTKILRELSKRKFKHIEIDNLYKKVKKINKKVSFQKQDQKYFHEVYCILFSEILKIIKRKKNIVVESTGASIEWKWLNKKLDNIPNLNIYRIFLKVPVRVARERIKKRNKDSIQEKIPLNFITYISKRMKIVKPKYDYVINANQPIKKIISDVLDVLQM